MALRGLEKTEDDMTGNSGGLIDTLMGLPIFQAEWVLWLLFALSIVSVAIMVERFVFYRRHAVDTGRVRNELASLLTRGDFDGAASLLEKHDSLETNVVLYGI